jgi:hypothetical protein
MLHVGRAPQFVMILEADVLNVVKDHEFVVRKGIKMIFCVS